MSSVSNSLNLPLSQIEFFNPDIKPGISDDAGAVVDEVKKFDTIRTLKTRGQICQSKLHTLIKFDFN